VKRFIAVTAVLFICFVSLSAARDKNDSESRILTGQVTDRSEAPLPNAIVYLKDTKTLTVKTFITDDKGNYRFPELSPNIDYQVYAEYKDARSETKTLSSFDSRLHPTINLKIVK
jgi:protocatechuate 3,4-dioxygenase beta subunit